MFSGIVEGMGRVVAIARPRGKVRLTISLPRGVSVSTRDSISVGGACLTVTGRRGRDISVDMVPETVRRTALGGLGTGSLVNLERPVPVDGRLGGHIVSGHVDGVGVVARVKKEGAGVRMRINPPADLMRYVVEKGSVTVDGVSLTVASVGADWLEVALIPFTLAKTTLGGLKAGSRVNLEADLLAKYVEKLLAGRSAVRGRRAR